mmetsp:Transcript_21080/g.48187  ORF Transcript_21080/g.48187 Transcript_21080/m.48187 type:complete len:220 (+) Transcript_21080:55-714(+)
MPDSRPQVVLPLLSGLSNPAGGQKSSSSLVEEPRLAVVLPSLVPRPKQSSLERDCSSSSSSSCGTLQDCTARSSDRSSSHGRSRPCTKPLRTSPQAPDAGHEHGWLPIRSRRRQALRLRPSTSITPSRPSPRATSTQLSTSSSSSASHSPSVESSASEAVLLESGALCLHEGVASSLHASAAGRACSRPCLRHRELQKAESRNMYSGSSSSMALWHWPH